MASVASIANSDKERRADAGHVDLISVTLELLREMLAVDCCAYLHQPFGEGARLAVCQGPSLAQRPDGFELLRGMKTVLETNEREGVIELSGLSGALFASNGPRSRGVHLIASASPLANSVRDSGRGLSGLLAAVIHRLEDPW